MCGHCKQVLPLDKFSPSYRGKCGTWCRACFAAYNRGERVPTALHEPLRCDYCGGEYLPMRADPRAAHYCSSKCKGDDRNGRLAREREASKPADRACLQCGEMLPQSKKADAVFCTEQCQQAATNRKKTPEERRATRLWSKYKITLQDYDDRMRSQGGLCAICLGADPRSKHGFWHVDHDHATGVIRGLLCGPCNTGLGMFLDTPESIESAAVYLRQAQDA